MKIFFHALVVLVLLPLAVLACLVFCDVLRLVCFSFDIFDSLPTVLFLGGFLVGSVFLCVCPPFVRTYVLGHELTHALWGLLFGARPSRLKVGHRGGSVRLTKTNWLITLSPYFFPFYPCLICALAALTRLFISPLPYLPVWSFLVGFSVAFHLMWTARALCQKQPDLKMYGTVFSLEIILILNASLAIFALVVFSPITCTHVAQIFFQWVSQGGAWILSLLY